MRAFAGLLRGRVAIGALQSLAELRLPGMLAAFHQRYPGITVALREGNSEPLIDSLPAGQLDLALAASFLFDAASAGCLAGYRDRATLYGGLGTDYGTHPPPSAP